MNELLRALLFLPEQASTFAAEIDALHYLVIIVTTLGALLVAALVLIFIVRYRESAYRAADQAPDERPSRSPGGVPIAVEGGLIVGLLALFVAFWVVGFRQFVQLSEPPENSLTIYVTGKQWMWSFAYPNGTGSNGVLYVPAGRPVKLVLTSRDVIHSFFVPAFRVKRDAVPGRSTMMWFEVEEPGTYPVYCTEYCGTGHSTMRAEVVALSEADFERQLEGLARLDIAAQVADAPTVPGEAVPAEPLSLATIGQRVAAERGCLRCHTVDGTPHIGPTFAGLYRATISLQAGGTIVADEAYLTASMMDPLAMIHLGFAPVMPSYQGLLSAGEVGALVEYIRALRDQPRRHVGAPLPLSTGGVPLVQPLPQPGRARGSAEVRP